MLRWLIPLIIISAFIIVFEVYAFQAIKMVSKNKAFRYSWLLLGGIAYVNFFYVIFRYDRSAGQTREFQWAVGLLLLVLLPKLIVLILDSFSSLELKNL